MDNVLVIIEPGIQLLQSLSPLSVAEISCKSLELHKLGLGNPLLTCAVAVFNSRMLQIENMPSKCMPFFLSVVRTVVVVIKVSLD